MIVAREEVPVSVHGDLQRCVTSESLHRLRRKPFFDPAGYREVSEPVPIEALDHWQQIKQRQELPLVQVVVAEVMTFPVGEDQVIWL